MFFFDHKFARDERHFAVSAITAQLAELVEGAGAAAEFRDFGKFGEEEAVCAAANTCAFATRNPAANQTLQGTPGKRPFLRQSLVSGVPDL